MAFNIRQRMGDRDSIRNYFLSLRVWRRRTLILLLDEILSRKRIDRLCVVEECYILSLAEEVRLLRAGTERRLTSRRLEAVGLEDTLEGLGGRATAAATSGLFGSHGRHRGVSGGSHFVLRLRQTFRMNARSKKWSLL